MKHLTTLIALAFGLLVLCSSSASADWNQIRSVQERLGESGPGSAWVNTDDLNDDGPKRNDLHYSDKGYQMPAERFADKAIQLLSAPNIQGNSQR